MNCFKMLLPKITRVDVLFHIKISKQKSKTFRIQFFILYITYIKCTLITEQHVTRQPLLNSKKIGPELSRTAIREIYAVT